MIRFILATYDTTQSTARRDASFKTRDISARVKSANWMYATQQPYEQATLRTTIRIDELDVFGIGVPIRGVDRFALHCSGWLEIYDDDVRVFLGLITKIKTGLKVGSKGERISEGVEITVFSWVSLLSRPFKLTERSELKQHAGLLGYDRWSRLFEQIFSTGSAVDVAQGFANAWSALAQYQTAKGEWLYDFPVVYDLETMTDVFIENRSITRVKGANLSQIQAMPSGSMWATLTQTFQPSPELIDLFPAWADGMPYIVYRMKPLAPLDDSQINEPRNYFNRNDILETDDNNLKTQIGAHTADAHQQITRILSYSISYENQRNNYIEVSSSYLGVSQLAGLNSAPFAEVEDIQRYGVSPLEITYPLLRTDKGARETIQSELEELTRYACALYADAHAFARGTIETMYQPHILIGEWVQWYDYTENEGGVLTGYVTAVSHSLNVDEHGTQQMRTQITVERVSQFGRRSNKKLVSELPIIVKVSPLETLEQKTLNED